MIKSMFSGVTGLKNHQTMMDVIGNNIANVNTAGFKASRVVFTDVYYQTISAANAPTATASGSNPTQLGYGSAVSSIDVLNTQSGFQQTFRPMDYYIAGEGYFVVDDGLGNIKYTRVGNLSFDINGNLIDASGNFVCGQAPTITPPATLADLDPIHIANYEDYSSVAIGENGIITGVRNNTVETLGQVALATFSNPDGLLQEGQMCYTQTANSGVPKISAPGEGGSGTLVSGGLEMSNVDLSKEFTDMIIAQRGLQANSRVITTSDEILQELVNLKR